MHFLVRTLADPAKETQRIASSGILKRVEG
jgi:hypothetical protein